MKRALIVCLALACLAGPAKGQDAGALAAVLMGAPSGATFNPLSLSPWAWWKADGNATDASGNGRNGTFSTPVYTNGVNSQAFRFAAAGYVGTVTNRMAGALTVCFWFRARGDYTTIQYIINDRAQAGVNTASFGVDFGGTDNEFVFRHGGTSVSISAISLDDDDWHHIAAVRTGSNGAWTITWYYDGALNDADNTAINPAASPGKITIGRNGDGTSVSITADIDDMMIFTSALTEAQILQIKNWRQ